MNAKTVEKIATAGVIQSGSPQEGWVALMEDGSEEVIASMFPISSRLYLGAQVLHRLVIISLDGVPMTEEYEWNLVEH